MWTLGSTGTRRSRRAAGSTTRQALHARHRNRHRGLPTCAGPAMMPPGDTAVAPWATATRDCPGPQAVAGEGRRVEPGEAGPVHDDQCDRIGVDRIAADPVARWRRPAPGTLGDARRRQPPDPPEQRPLGDRRGGDPGIERREGTEFGAPLRQPQPGTTGVLIRSCATAGTVRCRRRGGSRARARARRSRSAAARRQTRRAAAPGRAAQSHLLSC
jgi:hypothetical protein